MAEYWKSTPKYWCKHCQIYIRDTAFEKTQHEATGKHQGNLKRFLRDIHRNKEREERESQKTKNEVERLRNLVSGKPSTVPAITAGRSSALSNTPRQANAEDRKKQIMQLAEMGIAVPEEYRRDMALAGQWETISERRLSPAEGGKEDAESAKLNIGIRKRKHENDDEEEEAQILAKPIHKGWGNMTRNYPGAAGEDEDLDALLSSTTAVKRTTDLKPKPELGTQRAVGQAELETPTKADADEDPATLAKKEEPNATDSTQIPPPGIHDAEGVPSVVFKKRRNKAAKQ